MRPYLAIIKDSFREALATRILWATLILIAGFLLLLAPLRYETVLAGPLQFSDIQSLDGLVNDLRDPGDNTAHAYVAERLPATVRQRLNELTATSGRRDRFEMTGLLRESLNQLLRSENFYQETLIEPEKLSGEAKQLHARGVNTLSVPERARFHRLVLEQVFPSRFEPVGSSALQFYYLWYTIADPVSLTESALAEVVKLLVGIVVGSLVGNIGVFVALLVTAGMIPRMFDEGTVDLLLSKPIYRPLLFISKFLGACAFILVNAAFLIVGLWLILGIRFNMWIPGLLGTIPVYLFLFAIYYSVSAFVGVVWRNAIIAVVISIVFWALCAVVELTKSQLEQWVLNPRRIAAILPTEDGLLAFRYRGDGGLWNAQDQQWVQVVPPPRGFGARASDDYPFVGPYLSTNGDVVALRQGSGPRWLRTTDRFVVGRATTGWNFTEVGSLPSGSSTIATDTAGRIFIAGTSGLFELTEQSTSSDPTNMLDFARSLLGSGANKGSFVRRLDTVQPPITWRTPIAVAAHPQRPMLAVVAGQELITVDTSAAELSIIARQVIADTDTLNVAVALQGDRLLLTDGEGDLRVYNTSDLSLRRQLRPLGNNSVRYAAALAAGPYVALLFRNRQVLIYNTATDEIQPLSTWSQGNISAIAFRKTGELLIADQFGRIIEYNLDNGTQEIARYMTAPDFVESLYSRFIIPAYTVFPKPGGVQDVVQWLLTSRESVLIPERNSPATQEAEVLDIWGPVWSNSLFISVMVALSCLYIQRRDF